MSALKDVLGKTKEIEKEEDVKLSIREWQEVNRFAWREDNPLFFQAQSIAKGNN